jgi:hypothetical protein
MLNELAFDGKEERPFLNTYSMVYQWIEKSYLEVHVPQQPNGYRLMYRSDDNRTGRGPVYKGWRVR